MQIICFQILSHVDYKKRWCKCIQFGILQIEQFGATREVTIKRSERRLYPVNHKTYPGDTWAVVCSTEAPIGQKILHLRSIVQVNC